MRRQDKEVISREQQLKIIDGSAFCHVALVDGGEPYLIPMSFGRVGEVIYLHSADEGKKIGLFEKNPKVMLSFVYDAQVLANPEIACRWTFSYCSVNATGQLMEATDPEERGVALQSVMKHYSGREWPLPADGLAKTRVWRVVLQDLTGKRSSDKVDI